MSTLKSELLHALLSGASERDGRTIYELKSPAHLYLSGEQALTYLEAVLTSDYQGRLVEPLQELLRAKINKIVKPEDRPVCLVDLGPGVPLNTLPLINYLMSSSRGFWYLPVDISKTFLTITSCFFTDAPFRTITVQSLFENAATTLTTIRDLPAVHHRLINIGLTFNNFPLHTIRGILSSLFRPGDQILAASELIVEGAQDQLKPYQTSAAERFNYLPLRHLGIDASSLTYFVRFISNRIEMGFTTVRDLSLAPGHRISSGSEIITSVSYRHSIEAIRDCLGEIFSSVELLTISAGNVCILNVR